MNAGPKLAGGAKVSPPNGATENAAGENEVGTKGLKNGDCDGTLNGENPENG